MSASTTTLTVVEARRLLQHSARNMSSEEINDLQQIVASFQEARPRNQSCVACHSMFWQERIDTDGTSVWCCAGCHRPASLTRQQWFAEQTRQRAAADAHLRATEAGAPKPRAHLRTALAKLAEARSVLSKLEGALPASRAAVAEAQARYDRAAEAAETLNANAAERLAVAFFEGVKSGGTAPSAAAARAELAAATDELVVAQNARNILDTKVGAARSAVGFANDRAKKAARSVLAAEKTEELISNVIEAKSSYLEFVGQLGWLLRNHAIAGDQGAVRQLVADGNTPPAAWPDAATAGIAPMEAAMAALMADPEANIAT